MPVETQNVFSAKDRQLLVLLFFAMLLTGIAFVCQSNSSTQENEEIFTWQAGKPGTKTVSLYKASATQENPEHNIPPGIAYLLGDPLPINRAEIADLELLPGIGPELGRAIFLHRKGNGAFTNAKSLEKVSGIGKMLSTKIDSLVAYEQ